MEKSKLDLQEGIQRVKEENQSLNELNLSSTSSMRNLQNEIFSLREFEEELDKVLNVQVEILVLHKFIQDMEEKNYSLLIECQKHTEASRLSEKLISELETENPEQRVEAEFLLDKIEKLRKGIYQAFKTLQINLDNVQEERIEQEQILLQHIIGNIVHTILLFLYISCSPCDFICFKLCFQNRFPPNNPYFKESSSDLL